MEKKYMERSMMQQSSRNKNGQPQGGKTTFNPDHADRYQQRDTELSSNNGRSNKKRRSTYKNQENLLVKNYNNKSVQRHKNRAARDSAASTYSLEFQQHYNPRANETNPHTDRSGGDFKRGGYRYGNGEGRLSPHSRMILESEKQFLDNYGRRTEIERRTFQAE